MSGSEVESLSRDGARARPPGLPSCDQVAGAKQQSCWARVRHNEL